MSLHTSLAHKPVRAEPLYLRSERLGRCLCLIHEPTSITTPVVVSASAARRAAAHPTLVGLPIATSGAHGEPATLVVEASLYGPDLRELHIGGTTYPLDVEEVPAVRAWLEQVYGHV